MKNRSFQLKPSSSLYDQKGFTLVEAMVVVMIFTFIFGTSIVILTSWTDSWQISEVEVDLKNQIRRATESIKDDLRQASSVSVVNVFADGTDYATMEFGISNGVSGGNVVWSANNVVYALGGTGTDELQRTEGADVITLARNIEALTFRRDSSTPDIVEVTIQGSDQTDRGGGHQIDESITFEVQMRN